jgi:hypothetical protein
LKFSYRQILASAGGAVLSAIIASLFGVKGTIVGVAIGSVAATVGTAFLFQSIDRTHAAVKQVVVRVPEGTKLLHRLGGTDAAGVTQAETTGAPPATSAAQGDETADGANAGQPEMAQRDDARAPSATPGFRWPTVGVVAAVFVLSLVFVTVVELIAGRPLADLFGHSGGGTTVEKIFENNPAPTLPTTTTTTSTTTTSTTSTTSSSSSTTTTAVGSTTTSSTGLGSASTTTTGVPGTTTSTTTNAAG